MRLNEKNQAIALRSEGKSVREISQILRCPKSSISTWVRNVQLSDEQIALLKSNAKLNREKFSAKFATANNRNHLDSVIRIEQYRQEGRERAKIDADFRVICALYWGEGTKNKNVFAIANADYRMIRLIVRWLAEGGYLAKMTFTVGYHPANELTESDLKLWWKEKIVQLTDDHFRKFTCYKPREGVWRGKQKGKMLYGTGTIYVCNTRLRQMIEGGIESLCF